MGRPAIVITLSETEKLELVRRIMLRKGLQDARLRSEIILACAAGESGNVIAQRLARVKMWFRGGANCSLNRGC